MCGTCGCSGAEKATIIDLEKGEHTHIRADGKIITHSHSHDASHEHTHEHSHGDHTHEHSHGDIEEHGNMIVLQEAVMKKNDNLAARNRAWFAGREILALNLVSSPGSGKTSVLERTIIDQKENCKISVIEGDQQTANDAQRIKDTGVQSVQINTGTGCHLEADMVMEGLRILKPALGSIVMIENVGNLVCPAMFDLGEAAKVSILSVTEGEDKPLKYPHMFQASDLMLLNKIDLLPHLDFEVDRCIRYAKEVNPNIEVIKVSAKSGEGMPEWYDWCAKKAKLVNEQLFI